MAKVNPSVSSSESEAGAIWKLRATLLYGTLWLEDTNFIFDNILMNERSIKHIRHKRPVGPDLGSGKIHIATHSHIVPADLPAPDFIPPDKIHSEKWLLMQDCLTERSSRNSQINQSISILPHVYIYFVASHISIWGDRRSHQFRLMFSKQIPVFNIAENLKSIFGDRKIGLVSCK